MPISGKIRTFIVLKIKYLKRLPMDKITKKSADTQEKNKFSFPKGRFSKSVHVDFDAPCISSNGGLALCDMRGSLAAKIGQALPDTREKAFIRHPYEEMVCQRVGQIMCGYEDANDCDSLRHDSMLKMAVGRKPSDAALSSQPTMTRMENSIGKETLFVIAYLFLDHFVASYKKAPGRIIIDADDTNANTYGVQQLSLFNDYYGEYCFMPLLLMEGYSGKMILPLLRPGRRNKSLNVYGILRRVTEYLHAVWPHTVIMLRGDSHFCSHDFMEWAHRRHYVEFLTGLPGNATLLERVDKQRRMARNSYNKHKVPVCRYYSFYYKAQSWKYSQRVIAKVEYNGKGENVRFVVTSNRNNTPKTIYQRYCLRGEMELWIKDLKYFRADRMSCSSYRANYFRLFLYAAAYVMAYEMKHGLFAGTEVETFTMDSFMKRIMLSAVYIVEKKTFIRLSFSPNHRHRSMMVTALKRMSA